MLAESKKYRQTERKNGYIAKVMDAYINPRRPLKNKPKPNNHPMIIELKMFYPVEF